MAKKQQKLPRWRNSIDACCVRALRSASSIIEDARKDFEGSVCQLDDRLKPRLDTVPKSLKRKYLRYIRAINQCRRALRLLDSHR